MGGEYKFVGDIIDGIRYIVEDRTPSLFASDWRCPYCKTDFDIENFYVEKYKSKLFELKRIPPEGARDLGIVDKYIFLRAYLFASCNNCNAEYFIDEKAKYVPKKLVIEDLKRHYDAVVLHEFLGLPENYEWQLVKTIKLEYKDFYYMDYKTNM